MSDYGDGVSDDAIRKVDRRLRSIYGTARKELREKLRDFNQRYAEKDRAKRLQVAQGRITPQEYRNWKAGQVFQQKQWESKVREISRVMTNHNEEAIRIVNEGRLNVFAENYNYSAYIGETITGADFGVYNAEAVARLIKDDPQILPEWKIDEEKDYEWNQKKVNNIVNQGIIQGEGIPEITKRLCNDLSTQNENKMRMFARTAITGAQNAGRQEQMNDAADMGIEIHKQWIATLDSRTRDSHVNMDGEEVPYDEDFSNGLEYPGDPGGDPAEVYNCRCTMVSIYPKYEDRSKADVRRGRGEYTDADGEVHSYSYLTSNPERYQEWKHSKEKAGDFVHNYTKVELVDYDRSGNVVKIPKKNINIINRASKKIVKDFPQLDNYLRVVGFGQLDKGNPAQAGVEYKGNYPGFHLTLNSDMWRSVAGIKNFVKRQSESGKHIKSKKPEAIVAHEYGHSVFDAYVFKMAGYNGYGAMTDYQKETLVMRYYDFTTDAINAIIKNEPDGLTSIRSGDGTSEYVAEAFADYYYGERHKVSELIVEFFKVGFK